MRKNKSKKDRIMSNIKYFNKHNGIEKSKAWASIKRNHIRLQRSIDRNKETIKTVQGQLSRQNELLSLAEEFIAKNHNEFEFIDLTFGLSEKQQESFKKEIGN